MRRTTINSIRNGRTHVLAAIRFIANNRLVYGMLGLYIFGVLLGSLAVKYGSEPIVGELGAILSGYIGQRADQTFLPAFLSSFTMNFLVLFLVFFLGFCAIAPPVILFIAVGKGVSVGVAIGYLYASTGSTGMWYAVQNLVPVSLIASFATILACASSYKLSCIYFSMFSHKQAENSVSDAAEAYLTRYVVYTILIFVSALVDGLCCTVFGGISP